MAFVPYQKINQAKHDARCMKLRANLLEFRNRYGITQAEVAEKSGVSRATIINVENYGTASEHTCLILECYIRKNSPPKPKTEDSEILDILHILAEKEPETYHHIYELLFAMNKRQTLDTIKKHDGYRDLPEEYYETAK